MMERGLSKIKSAKLSGHYQVRKTLDFTLPASTNRVGVMMGGGGLGRQKI